MDFEKILLKDLVPTDYNPRIMSEEEFNHLRNSINEFGLVDPIIVNLKNNHIIGGHQRYDILMEKYEDELSDFEFNLIRLGNVGWVFTEDNLDVKDDNYEKALNVPLNKISGNWDFSKLNEMLDDLELTGFDVSLTGFDGLDNLDVNLKDDVDEKDYNPLGDLIDKYEDNDTSEQDSLKRDYIMPPFSILRAYGSDWINLKKQLKDEINDEGESRENVMGSQLGTSIFDPVLALIILKWFLPNQSSKIVDCFSGDSAVGYLASKLGHNFTGIELREEQVNLNNSRMPNNNAKYICDDGCNVLNHVEENSQDLFFSCPPYYDLEVYSDLPNDASNQGTYEEFMKIIDVAFTNSIKTLKDNRFAIIVASDIRDKEGYYYPFTTDIKNIFKKNGMGLYNDIILANALTTAGLRARQTFKTRKVVRVHQNVMCFYKGDVKKIKDEFKLECEL